MMTDTTIIILVLMGFIVSFYIGWGVGKNEYLDEKFKKKRMKSVEDLQYDLSEAIRIEDYEKASRIKFQLEIRVKRER